MKFYRFITPVPAGTKPLQTIVPYPRPNLTKGAGTWPDFLQRDQKYVFFGCSGHFGQSHLLRCAFFSILFLFVCFAVLYSHWDQLNRVTLFSRRRRREYWRIVTETNLVEVTIRRYCFGIITLMLIRENKIKKRHVFERFWGFKMSVEGGSDRQQAGFLIVAAVGFPHGNVIFCQTFINSSSSMFSISFVNSWCCWNHSVEQNIWQKLLDVPTLRSKKV